MALYKGKLNKAEYLPKVEKHFHDHDEIWIVLSGWCSAFEIDRQGNRKDFKLNAKDVWVVEVGYEHGCTDGSKDLMVAFVNGTRPSGAHKSGHYKMEKNQYIPSFELKKTPTKRYDGE